MVEVTGDDNGISQTPASITLATAVTQFVARRRALFGFLGALALAVAAHRAAPYLAQDTTIYERLDLDWSWVLMVAGLAGLYCGAGFLCHRGDGLPQRFPLLATGTATLTLICVCATILDVGAEWTPAESVAALAILGFSACAVLVGFAGYTELWRSLFNKRIVLNVLAMLPGGAEASRKLVDEDITHVLPTSIRDSPFRTKVAQQVSKKEWGSPHCLTIVQGAFDGHREALHSATLGHTPSDKYDTCLGVGADLLLYLSMRWPVSYASTEYVRWLRLELVRELLTIWRQGTALQQQQHRQPASRWMNELRTARDPYHQFLAYCVSLGVAQTTLSPSATLKSVTTATELYREVSNGVEVPTGIVTDVQDICSNTWLVLSERALPRQACVDVWMAMRESKHGPLVPLIPVVQSTYNGEPHRGTETTVLGARRVLMSHYSEWSRRLHSDWNAGIAGRRLLVGD